MIKNLVLSGGSIKGITYYGVLRAIYDNKTFYDGIETFAGASAGSIFATFLYLNIDYEHLEKIIEYNFGELLNFDLEHLFEDYGLDNGNTYMELLDEALGDYKDITFREAYEKTGKRLIISVTCLSNYNIEYFDYVSHPKLKIKEAIRASISIPFLFTPVKMDDKVYIDGAIIESLPLPIFNKENTLGVWITNTDKYMKKLNSINDYIYNFLMCVKSKLNNLYNFEKRYNVIKIEIEGSGMNFGMGIKKKKEIIKIGYEKMIGYLKKNV